MALWWSCLLGRQTHEINADGTDVALCVCVVSETQQQARLADTGVADQKQLEKVITAGPQPTRSAPLALKVTVSGAAA